MAKFSGHEIGASNAGQENIFRVSSSARSAFTLVELLVAMAAVAVLVLVIAAMTTNMSALIKITGKKLAADDEARVVFDTLADDFSAMIKRPDIDYQFNNRTSEQNGSATLFFYSEAPAVSASATMTDNSTASLVGYRINSSYQLERLGKGLRWISNGTGSGNANSMVYLAYAAYPVTSASVPLPGSNLGDAFSAVALNSQDSNYHVLGAGVFRFDFWFLLKPFQQADGTYEPAIYSNFPYDTRRKDPVHTSLHAIGLEDVQAIVVSIAIMDSASRHLLPANVNWSKIANALLDPEDPFVAPTWEATVSNTSAFASTTGVPTPAAAQVRVYERTFNLITPSNP